MQANPFPRRSFLKRAVGAASVTTVAELVDALPEADARLAPQRHFEIESIDRVTVRIPFREIPERNMNREIPHWKWSEILSVRLKSGVVGHGETLLYYTWHATTDSDVKSAQGKNAVSIMWNDDLGAGLQMALFDAVAKTAGVPIHALLGRKVHDRTPIAWWNIDTSPADMAAECAEAYRQGYRAYKSKGRPWFDVWKMCEETSKAVPDDFHVALDFNDTLLDAERGIPVLKELEKYKQVAIWETPIFQSDIAGNQAIRRECRAPVAMHYGNPKPVDAIREKTCDGFVIGGGASRLMRQGTVSAMADMPFWLQIVGTGISATWSLHFGAVNSHATWPAVNCHQLFEHQLLAEPFTVRDGFTGVPNRPGLGCEIDWDAVQKYKVKKPDRRPDPPRLLETTWPDGRRMYVANNGRVNFMLNAARRGEMPYFERGVFTRQLPDDGTDQWKDLYTRARKKPLILT